MQITNPESQRELTQMRCQCCRARKPIHWTIRVFQSPGSCWLADNPGGLSWRCFFTCKSKLQNITANGRKQRNNKNGSGKLRVNCRSEGKGSTNLGSNWKVVQPRTFFFQGIPHGPLGELRRLVQMTVTWKQSFKLCMTWHHFCAWHLKLKPSRS